MLQDLRYAVRLIRAQPGFSLVAIATLALGIGATTTLFTVLDATILRRVPYPEPEQLVRLSERVPHPDGREEIRFLKLSTEDVRQWKALTGVFSHFATRAFERRVFVLHEAAEPERFGVGEAVVVTEDYFGMLGIEPAIGRGFRPSDTNPGAPVAVVLGDAYWSRRYGRDPAVIGRPIRFASASATIVGVMPPAAEPGVTLWLSGHVGTALGLARAQGRLRDGVTVADAQRRLDEVAGQLSQGGVSVEGPIRVEPLFAETFHLLNATLMRSLTGAVAAVLLIAAVNVAGMILARGLTRRAEVSVRYALGASTPRIIRQLLTETMLLAGAGGVAGVAVAVWSFDALLVVFPDLVPRAEAPPLSLEVLTASAALTIVAGLGVGLYPALRLSRSHGAAFLAQAHPAGHGTARVRSGRWMVGAEVALAVALLCVAGLLVRNISLVAAADMGVDPSSFLSFDVEPIEEDETRRTGQYAALLDAIRNLPEVEAAGGRWTIGTAFSVAVAGDGPAERAIRRAVSAGYLEALGAEAIQGSLPTEQDAARGVPIVVINQEAARRFFPDGPAVGRTLTVQRAAFKVVGVVRDVRLQDPLRLNAPELYVVQPGGPDWPVMTVVVRPLGPAPRLPERLREAATALSVPAVVGPVRTGGSWLWENAAVEMRGRYAMLLSLFAGLGVLLSAVGIFGVTAYAVARRTREIGVRLALGSSPARAIREMMRETAVPMGLGIVAGLFGAALASRAIAHLLVGVSPHDPLTYLVVAVMFAGLAMFAAWVPARRAARVDPVHALRTE